jgi:lipopolysaccharide export system protein LptA
MSPTRDVVVVLALAMIAAGAAAEPAPKPSPPIAVPGLRDDRPITVTARTLEYDYKRNVVVYRGDVRAEQDDVHLQSDELTIRLTDAAPAKSGREDEQDRPAGEATLGGRVQLR